MAIDSLKFQNFKVFRDAELRLGRTTLIIGANGSGKSTCMDALRILEQMQTSSSAIPRLAAHISFGISLWDGVRITADCQGSKINIIVGEWDNFDSLTRDRKQESLSELSKQFGTIRVFSFEHQKIKESSPLEKTLRIQSDGAGLANVLTNLQDQFPENFDSLNQDLMAWLPEFDRVLLDTVENNKRSFQLRTKEGKHRVPAGLLSEGTLLSVALLTLRHLPDPPAIIGIEDPDRGMHPRLLRDLLDAIRHLTHPEEFGDSRKPVQVVMTTHSPYFVDLFHDHLEDVVVVEKKGLWSTLTRLSDIPHVQEIVRDAHLGETWFNGVLGGVPVHT